MHSLFIRNARLVFLKGNLFLEMSILLYFGEKKLRTNPSLYSSWALYEKPSEVVISFLRKRSDSHSIIFDNSNLLLVVIGYF